MLEIPISRVVCKTKRVGGGFGGKEVRPMMVALPAAFAAAKLNRPVRCSLDRCEDMLITGTRHPFLMKYKIAVNKDGRIKACEMYIYANGGHSHDLSYIVLQRTLYHFQNSYYIPNVRLLGYVCKTNLPSNTSFRGFGAPQGLLVAEYMIRDVADRLGMPPEDVAKLNLCKDGDFTHYNQKLEYCTLTRCWEECFERAKFASRKRDVKQFNRCVYHRSGGGRFIDLII